METTLGLRTQCIPSYRMTGNSDVTRFGKVCGPSANNLAFLSDPLDEGNTLTLHLANVPVVDQGFFPGGTGTAPATVSFDIVYKKVEGTLRTVRPSTRDRLSPFTWAGKMWRATNSGTFSVSYNDKSFSATGSFMTDTTNPDTTGFGEMGLERNGSFVKDEDFKAADAAAHFAAGDRGAGAAAVETQSAGVRPGPYRTSVLVNQLHQ